MFILSLISARSLLAPNAVGVTRDENLAQQLINLIFCKIYDEKFTKPNDMVNFRHGINENVEDVKKRIVKLFDSVKQRYPDVIDKNDSITLDAKSISYVVGQLQRFCLLEASRDAVGDAFEVFIGHTLKGEQGQFFTPKNVVKMIVDMIDINERALNLARSNANINKVDSNIFESNIYSNVNKKWKILNASTISS